jgi:uncharacterized membrane protein YdbT with pleckstrin-like domain
VPEKPPPNGLEKHLRPDETVHWWGKPSPLGLLGTLVPAIVGVAIGLPALYLFVTGTSELASVVALIGGIAAVAALGQATDRFMAVMFTTYVVTDQRVVSIRSLLSTTTSSVPLDRVSAIEQRHGIVDHVLGLDDVKVSAYGKAGTTIGVPALADATPLRTELAQLTVQTATPRWLLRGD